MLRFAAAHAARAARGTGTRAFAAVPDGALQVGRLNHVAIAVPDLDKSISLYRDVLGAKVDAPEVRGASARSRVRTLARLTPAARRTCRSTA